MIKITYEQFCDMCGKEAVQKEEYELVEGSVTPESRRAPMITGGYDKHTLCASCYTLAWDVLMTAFHARRKTGSK